MNNSVEKLSVVCENRFNDLLCSSSSKRKGSNKGYTLIELFIVIAIIGTLSAIAVPSYLRYKYEAKTVVAITDIQMIEKQIALFVFDNY